MRHPKPFGLPILIGDEITFLHARERVTASVTGIRCFDEEVFIFVDEHNSPRGGLFGPVRIENVLEHKPQE